MGEVLEVKRPWSATTILISGCENHRVSHMILELPRKTLRLGGLKFREVQRVYELDSGATKFPTKVREAVATVSSDEIDVVNQKMVVVVPVKDEATNLLEGVLSGIPHDCQVIVVSNSGRSPVNRFQMELETIREFNHFVNDRITLVHQKDPGIAEAFKTLGYESVLEDGLVRDGKAEGMFVAMALAKMMGKEYVGFIDADNFIPGAVHEYVEIFAAGFTLSESPYSMIRVSWANKPKIEEDQMIFPKWGRVSEVTNACINKLIESHTSFGTDIVRTGNAGEHAISMALADLLPFESGFALETYELVSIMEQFGGLIPSLHPDVVSKGVDVFQIETRNPHLHADKGDAHIEEMLTSSLKAIYGSPICTDKVKTVILEALNSAGVNPEGLGPPYPPKTKPLSGLDIKRFERSLRAKAQTLTEFGR